MVVLMKDIVLTQEQKDRYDKELASNTWKKYYDARIWIFRE